MLTFVPYRPEHMKAIKLQLAHEYLECAFGEFDGRGLDVPDLSFTGLRVDADGTRTVVGAAGLVPHWKGRAQAWANLSIVRPTEWPAVHRQVRRVFSFASQKLGYRRIEAYIDPTFDASVRWANMLGFVDETPNGMQMWGLDGRTFHLYARIS